MGQALAFSHRSDRARHLTSVRSLNGHPSALPHAHHQAQGSGEVGIAIPPSEERQDGAHAVPHDNVHSHGGAPYVFGGLAGGMAVGMRGVP
jgi:hypothetical protein